MNVRLPGLATVRVSGADAADLLGRILTNDVRRLAMGDVQRTARLDDRGRILALMHLARVGPDAFVVAVDDGVPSQEVEAIDRFVFGEDVCVTAVAGDGWWTDEAAPATGWTRTRFGRAGWDVPGEAPSDALPAGSLERARIRAGELRWPSDAPGNALLSDLGLSDIASLDKGCYPGQETIQRQLSRGQTRKALVGLWLDGPAPTNAPLIDQGDVVGRLGTSAPDPARGVVALGVVRRPFDTPGTRLRVADTSATVVSLPMPP